MAQTTSEIHSWSPRNPCGFILASDAAADDSDKTITVPSGESWEIKSIRVEYTATATAGTRTLAILFRDATDDVIHGFTVSNASITASQVMVFNFYPDAPTVAPTDGAVEGTQALSHGLILPAGWDIRIYDSADVDATADDVVIHVTAKRMR